MPGEHADRTKPALALSGGGFRATLYHLGAVIRLNELGLLGQIERISSVSGGSITAGMLGAAWARLTFENGVATNLDAEVGIPLQNFCKRQVDVAVTGWGSVLPGKTIGDVLADTYDDLYAGMTLQALPDRPQFLFNATNIQTGRLLRMHKVRLADYSIGEIPEPRIRLAVAVAASSAFPPVLSPVTIELDPKLWRNFEGTIHFGDEKYKRLLTLMDGGAYDNLGLETIDNFATMIVSDAGAPFAMEEDVNSLWAKQAMRAVDIATDQARALRKRLMHAEGTSTGRIYAYAAIDGDPGEYKASRTLVVNSDLAGPLARIRTRLNPFSDKEQGQLINWGWYMTDLAVRSYVDKNAAPPTAWPMPQWPLG